MRFKNLTSFTSTLKHSKQENFFRGGFVNRKLVVQDQKDPVIHSSELRLGGPRHQRQLRTTNSRE